LKVKVKKFKKYHKFNSNHIWDIKFQLNLICQLEFLLKMRKIQNQWKKKKIVEIEISTLIIDIFKCDNKCDGIFFLFVVEYFFVYPFDLKKIFEQITKNK